MEKNLALRKKILSATLAGLAAVVMTAAPLSMASAADMKGRPPVKAAVMNHNNDRNDKADIHKNRAGDKKQIEKARKDNDKKGFDKKDVRKGDKKDFRKGDKKDFRQGDKKNFRKGDKKDFRKDVKKDGKDKVKNNKFGQKQHRPDNKKMPAPRK